MTLQQLLDTRVSERSTLVRHIASYLEHDKRVRAAWLHGSLASGKHDALSDIDVWVVIDDEAASSIYSGRKKFITGPGRPSLMMDNIKNAPPQGAYMLVHYPGEVGPQHVDWFWQPESLAKYPDDALLLFDRADLPAVPGDEWRDEMHQTDDRSPFNETALSSILTFKSKFFWTMSLIVAKYIARGDSETVDRMLELITRTLTETNDALRAKPRGDTGDTTFALDIKLTTAAEQFAMLDRLVKTARRMEKPIRAAGGAVPSDGIPQIQRFFELTKQMTESR